MSSAFSDRIIQSLLDTDFYKLTMMQAVPHHYPNAEVEWAFRSRSGEDLSPYLSEIRHQIEALAELQMSAEELAFLEARPYMQPDFIRFRLFRFDLRYLRVDVEDGELVMYLRGPWLHVILFEVPLLAIVSEVRNRARYAQVTLEQAGARLDESSPGCAARRLPRSWPASPWLTSAPGDDSPSRFRPWWSSACAATFPAVSSAPATCIWPARWT